MEYADYSYDARRQVAQYKVNNNVVRSYDYDPNGNVTTFTGKTLSYGNDNNQLTGERSEIGRFLGVDPLAGVYPAWIPYHYALR